MLSISAKHLFASFFNVCLQADIVVQPWQTSASRTPMMSSTTGSWRCSAQSRRTTSAVSATRGTLGRTTGRKSSLWGMSPGNSCGFARSVQPMQRAMSEARGATTKIKTKTKTKTKTKMGAKIKTTTTNVIHTMMEQKKASAPMSFEGIEKFVQVGVFV